MYTFASNSNSQSCLDRIYTRLDLAKSLYDWDTATTSIPSDHKLILVCFTPPKTPYVGHGRWTWPLRLLSNNDLTKQIAALGIELQTALDDPTAPTGSNAQQKWNQFKIDITDLAKRTARVQLAKLDNHINTLKKDIACATQDLLTDQQEATRSNIITLENELKHIQRKRYKNMHARTQAQWHDRGEKISKYWTAVNTPRRPRNIIYSLRDPNTNTLTKKSSKMAEIARNYHDELQQTNHPVHDDPLCEAARMSVLSEIPPAQTLNDQHSPLPSLITEDQITQALCVSKNGTTTGLNGIPYELWKSLNTLHVTNSKLQKPTFDIIKCLRLIYNEIQTEGTDPTSQFAVGWMCPIYKKKDQTKIENYRPIALLNTDYKLMTKVLATQLALHACNLLDPDQMEFVPTRSIFNPIRLAETMCAYADFMEENSAIIALDQEKAYDKIDHEYLIDMLKTFCLPDLFVNTIKSIYLHTSTSVAINGVLSKPYQVTRGVQQGDPLSCLLFNLAIEPLAAAIRNSPELTGFTIPRNNYECSSKPICRRHHSLLIGV